MNDQIIVKTFLKAVKINSASGHEQRMAKWVASKMKEYGWKVWIDNAGHENNSNTGNVYAYFEKDPHLPLLVFVAHLDTVQKVDEPVKPVFDGKKFKSSGDTILGADNKAGIVALLILASSLNKEKISTNLLFFFSTREEAGLMGSSFFNFDEERVKYFFNVDSTDKPGVFIYKSLGYLNFKIEILGVAAHAAKSYEKGKNAIVASADLISNLPLGKHKEGWTLNIGIIKGGQATNVVCDKVEMKGELRAFEIERMKEIKSLVKEICKKVEEEHKLKVNILFEGDSYIAPFKGSLGSKICKVCQKACKRLGLECKFKESYSTSDANIFSGKDFEVISVSRGGRNSHAKNEELSLKELKQTIKLLQEIVLVEE